MVALNGVVQRLSSLYKSPKWYDIEFHFESDSTGGVIVLFAHRLILAPMSDVFEAMCYGPMAERTPVVVTDITATIFKAMLQYFYTDHLPIDSVDDAFQLLYASRKYLVDSMSELVRTYLVSKIGDTHCIDIYHYADLADDGGLKEMALQHICRRLNFVVDLFNEDNLSDNLILDLSKAEQINCREIILAKLAEKWAANACASRGLDTTSENMRNLLVQHNIFDGIHWKELNEEDLFLIREGLISKDEISSLPARRKRIYFEPRLIWVYMSMLSDFKDSKDLNMASSVTTSIKVRTPMQLRGLMLHAMNLPYEKLPLFTLRHMPQKYTERLEVTILRGKDVLTRVNFTKEVAYGEHFKIPLPEVILKQNIQYDINIRFLTCRNNSPLYRFSSASIPNPHGLNVTCEKTVWEDNIPIEPNSFSFIDAFLCTF